MKLKFITNSGHIATLGTFLPVNKRDLVVYVKRFDLCWLEI